MKVLHVTEASGAGVLTSMLGLARAQAKDGHQVTILIALRGDSPSTDEIEAMAGLNVPVYFLSSRGMTFRTAKEMGLAIIRRLGSGKNRPDYIHYHSTFAGVVGRMISALMFSSKKSFYSPHGFAFLRQDVRPLTRNVLTALECSLHKLGSTMVVVSASEMNVGARAVGSKRIFILENGIETESLPARTQRSSTVIKVGTAARIVHQKAPWKFASLANQVTGIRDDVQFFWIGGGEQADQTKWLNSSNVSISGWLSPVESLEKMAALDIYVSTALWEGLPMSVIQAQALGIPCVVSSAVGHSDIVENGVTGYICDTESEMLDRILELVQNPSLRSSFGKAGKLLALDRFDSAHTSRQSISIYSNRGK